MKKNNVYEHGLPKTIQLRDVPYQDLIGALEQASQISDEQTVDVDITVRNLHEIEAIEHYVQQQAVLKMIDKIKKPLKQPIPPGRYIYVEDLTGLLGAT